MPKIKDDRVRITQWEYKSPMNAKQVLGSDWKADRHYRFVRPDNVERMRDVYGYTSTSKKFKDLILMETSKDHHDENRKEVSDRNRAKTRALEESLRREVQNSGQGKVDFEEN